jgi:Rps23 Pro-64 3,4-dihydroxylase Tpa1-like proline 4-hydroxylase
VNNTLIQVQLLLEGGHSQNVEMRADAPELGQMFQILGTRSSGSENVPEQLIQLPLDEGRESFSFNSAQLVAVITRPPVVIEFEHPVQAVQDLPAPAMQIERPQYMVIDDFLGYYEHRDMLAHAMQLQDKFGAGTTVDGVVNSRQNLAILDFCEHAHSTLLVNRLLTWFPLMVSTLGIVPFPIREVESQLTANNDGHYYRAHLDADAQTLQHRVLTCVYYFSKQPAQFNGGALRIYDKQISGGQVSQAQTYQEVEPVSNRMVVFPSNSYHELMPIRCPSRKFEDSRFAVTNWIWSSAEPDPEASHGWGHMHCNKVPVDWLVVGGEPR